MSRRIETRRLNLLPVEADDAAPILALLHLPEVRRFLCDDALMPADRVETMIRESHDPAEVTQFWRITQSSEETIGLIGLRAPSADMTGLRAIGWRSLELVVALDPGAWGRGLASEAVEAVASYAARDGVTFALLGGVNEPNIRSHALMRRSGFTELGRVRGPVHPIVVYERLL